MNWLTGNIGGGGGGWDEDDGLDDLSDQSLEQPDEEEVDYDEDVVVDEEEEEEQQPEASTEDHLVQGLVSPPPTLPSPGTVPLGSGLFMGRLTRFIEAVTQPTNDHEEYDDDDEEVDQSGGWDDDDLADLDDDLEEEDEQQQQQQELEVEVDLDEPAFPTPQPPQESPGSTMRTSNRMQSPTPTTTSEALVESTMNTTGATGWDDELDLSFEPQATDDAELPLYPEEAYDDTVAPALQGPSMARNLFLDEPPTTTTAATGTTAADQDDANSNQNVMLQNIPYPSRQISSLSNNDMSETAVADFTLTSCWDEDDGLDALVEEEIAEGAAPVVDHMPPPPAPRPTSPLSRSVSFSGASGAAVAPASGVSSEGCNDDGDGSFNANQHDTIIDQTPPPPPSPRKGDQAVSVAARSTGAVAPSTDSVWDEDGLDDLDVDETPEEYQARDKMVDMTPLPPLPRENRASASTVAVAAVAAADGWDDEDDDLDNLDEDEETLQEQDNTPMVDHTPPPPPPPDSNSRDTITEVAIAEDDDISRDDTLSIANSRARYEEQKILNSQPPGPPVVDRIPEALSEPIPFRRSETFDAVRSGNSIGSSVYAYDDNRAFASGSTIPEDVIPEETIVDHTPSVNTAGLKGDASTEQSMRTLYGGNTGTNSSVAESWDTLSDRMSEPRSRSRRMVDMTPSSTRYNRGGQLDVSLGVAGHVSIGESLDSIDEAGEELDSPGHSIGDEFVVDISSRDRSFFPFDLGHSALTMGGGIPRTTAEHDEDDSDDGRPLVDHTPLPLVKNQSTGASVEVLSVSSEEGDLGESIVGTDDVKDDLYGNVVDHTPATPNPRRGNVTAKLADSGIRHEDDTVAGFAEDIDVEKDIQADNDMDDESSRGTKTNQDELENRSLFSTVRLSIPEEKQLVDHVPPEDRKMVKTADASTVVFADVSEGSSHVDDDIGNDDDTAPTGFGPIVDHTPSVHFRSSRSIATSVATQHSALDAELKEDEDLDNTVEPAGASTGDEFDGWDAEQGSLPPSVREEKFLVDHIPRRMGRGGNCDGSMRVIVDNADDSTQIDTIAEDAATQFGPVVDHTPFFARTTSASVAASVIAVAPKPHDEIDDTSAVDGSLGAGGNGWENDIPDLEDISVGDDDDVKESKEPTVVDHVPVRSSFPRPADASTMALVDPADQAADDDSGTNHDTGSSFGPVVDQTPTPPLSSVMPSVDTSMQVLGGDVNGGGRLPEEDLEDGGTWFGASTVGGVSTIGASGEEIGENSSGEGWEDDANVLDDLTPPATAARPAKDDGRHMVDHVPDIVLPRPTDESMAVICDRSVASSHEKEDLEGNSDEGTFGAVVDHTPSITRTSNISIANSMVTAATGIVTDIKRDEDMDETTWNGGESTKDNQDGWDHDEPELEGIGADEDDQTPPVVDHVPERPESRPTDASTFVAGDPSEIFSEVDDLGQDETHFGPVVDQLPRPSYSRHTSAAGSTIVNIASVVEDDLDVAVERAIDGEDLRLDAQEQSGWQETLPNPQSGNEEDNQDQEQLVDYVPAEEETEIPDLVRDGSSEVATVGEKSNILPADDPKEDEFGPVVDHLPIPELSSVSSPIPPRGGSYDRKPAASTGGHVVDSVAPNFSVESKASKDDGLDEDEFGPVVDQLPTSSSRASVTPSRGGSTVDALATVSEVDDDYVAGDGWEDDVDLDTGDRSSPLATASRSTDDRNLSVKWIDGLNGKSPPTSTNGNGSSEFFDTVSQPLNETRYYDPELGHTNAWGSPHVDDSDGDETPPSTPRRQMAESEGTGTYSMAVNSSQGDGDCRLCANSSTADCPCIKRLLAANDGVDGIVGTLKTPEGPTIQVNFDKLLVTEMTKRRLVEKEFQALKSTIESLKASKDTLVLAGETQMEVLNKLKSSNSALQQTIESTKSESEGLRSQNGDFQSLNKILQQQVTVLVQEKQKLQSECLSLQRDTEVLQSNLRQVSSSASSELSARDSKLESEITQWKSSNESLIHRIATFETECENLRGKNESLYEDLESYRSSMSKLEEENASILSRESSLSVEVEQLRIALQKQEVFAVGTLQDQLKSLQIEVAAKSGECAELKSQVAAIQKRLMVSEAEKFKQTKELARATQDKKQTILDFEKRLSTSKMENESLLSAKDSVIDELQIKSMTTNETLQQLRKEKETLEQRLRSDTVAHQVTVVEKGREIAGLENSLKTTSTKIDSLEKEKVAFINEMAVLRERSIVAEAKAGELLAVSKEKDELKAALTKADSSIAILQQKHEQMSQGILPELQQKIDSLRLERDQLVLDLSASRDQLEDASLSLLSIEAENERLRQLLDENERSRKLHEGAVTASQVNTRELEDVKLQLAELNEQNTQLMAEQAELADRFLQAQNHLGNAAAELERALMEQNRLESVLREREQHATMMEEELNNAKVDRLGLQSQLQALEGSRGEASMNQKAMEDLAREYGTLRHELMQSRQKCSQQDEEMRLLKQDIANAELYHDENASLLSKVEELEGRLQDADQGRQSLGRVAAEYEQRMEEMSQQLNSISQERDQLLEERRMMEEENEEMLVQFGLLKEDMDATDVHVEQLEAGRSQLDQTAQNYLRELQETQQRLHDLTASLELESNEALLAADAAKEQLILEKGDLVTSVQELTRRNQKMEVTLKNIESEKEALMVRIADLQRQVSDVTQDRQTKESRLLAIIEDMEVKNQDLSDAAHFREKDIVELQSSLARSEEIGKDADDLRLKVNTLQQSLSDSQRLLLQKDSALEDLRIQLDSAGKKPVESSELENLRRTVREMEESAERDRSHIQELEHLTDETTRELRKTRDRLSASENLVSQLRVDLEAKRHKEREIEDLQERLVSTERRLEQANQDTLAFRSESTDLRGSLTALEVELENHRRNLHQPAKEPSGQASAELQSLRQQIEMLKQQQIASSSQTGAREENIEREVFLLQQQMRQKDTEIGKLQSQLHSLDSDLSIKHKELESKQEYVDKLSSELQDLRTQSATTRALDLTRDDAENTEKMRQQIVSLAKALERSEGRRALVIERLEGERQANADSLRRLTESVKRFYGTLSMGES